MRAHRLAGCGNDGDGIWVHAAHELGQLRFEHRISSKMKIWQSYCSREKCAAETGPLCVPLPEPLRSLRLSDRVPIHKARARKEFLNAEDAEVRAEDAEDSPF